MVLYKGVYAKPEASQIKLFAQRFRLDLWCFTVWCFTLPDTYNVLPIKRLRLYTRLPGTKQSQKFLKSNCSPSDFSVIYGASLLLILLSKSLQSFVGHAHNLDASVMTFQPIQGIQAFKLPPVEETRSLAY